MFVNKKPIVMPEVIVTTAWGLKLSLLILLLLNILPFLKNLNLLLFVWSGNLTVNLTPD